MGLFLFSRGLRLKVDRVPLLKIGLRAVKFGAESDYLGIRAAGGGAGAWCGRDCGAGQQSGGAAEQCPA